MGAELTRFASLILCAWMWAASAAPAQLAEVSEETASEDRRHVWTGPQSGDALAQLAGAIAEAGSHGLDPWDYGLIHLLAVPDRPDPEIDRMATASYLALAGDLLQGRIPIRDRLRWPFQPRERDLDAWLAQAMETGEIAASLDALAPRHSEYTALRSALTAHLSLSPDSWPAPIGEGEALEAGATGPRVAALRARLEVLGYLAPAAEAEKADPEAALFDAETTVALQQAQRDAHLEPDGVAGAETIAWLDTPQYQRIAQLQANLERWRWLPDDLGAHHIRVNLPDYRLTVHEDGELVRSHDVIIGRPSRASPVLTAVMTHVIANPWWETPHSLAVRDELPLFRRDPDAVSRLGFQIIERATGNVVDPSGIDWTAVSAANFPYRLRQAPGPLNALGQVKLIFPNLHNTYLHDTPSRTLFGRAARAFSSGCVRVRDPVELAQWAASAGSGLPAEALQAALASGREARFDLARPVYVHFLYFTALAGPDGRVRFVPDVYGRDGQVIAALGMPQPLPRPASPAAEPVSGECAPAQ